MRELEARALIESTGNYCEEDEIEDVMEVYKALEKHLGWEDKRRDRRFVVKFHDIFWYTPEEFTNKERFNDLFDMFCNDQYDYVVEDLTYHNIDVNEMMSRYDSGHYQTFMVGIPNITEENILDLTQEIYNEYYVEGDKYVENYIYTVETLQSLEDNYMDYWIEFLKDNEVDEKIVKEIEEKYNKERKK